MLDKSANDVTRRSLKNVKKLAKMSHSQLLFMESFVEDLLNLQTIRDGIMSIS